MKAEYLDEYGEYTPCLLLATNLKGTMCLILLEGVRGWCSSNLVIEHWT
jgi:hypothetical protein